jgi:membrane-bound lytic murein transglycosylase B
MQLRRFFRRSGGQVADARRAAHCGKYRRDHGVNQGKYSTVRSLATLAYDCRRSEKFQAELLDALRLIERGDLTSHEMIGAWAGKVGQTQFLPSAYLKFAVDFEGLGHRDLVHSALNALASTAMLGCALLGDEAILGLQS